MVGMSLARTSEESFGNPKTNSHTRNSESARDRAIVNFGRGMSRAVLDTSPACRSTLLATQRLAVVAAARMTERAAWKFVS